MSARNQKIVILDYEVGNIFNLKRALMLYTSNVILSNKPEDILSADKLILPGVGSFQCGIHALKQFNLDIVMSEFKNTGKTIFGICLGMQLLMDSSEEDGIHEGLSYISGQVIKLNAEAIQNKKIKIPQISWNTIVPLGQDKVSWENTILKSLPADAYMYFVHSYICKPSDEKYILAQTNYGSNTFCSVIQKENIVGCQFHPELSGQAGLKIIENFVNL